MNRERVLAALQSAEFEHLKPEFGLMDQPVLDDPEWPFQIMAKSRKIQDPAFLEQQMIDEVKRDLEMISHHPEWNVERYKLWLYQVPRKDDSSMIRYAKGVISDVRKA